MSEATPEWDIRSYSEELAANIGAERARAGLSQELLAARMWRLGFSSWVYQTVGKVEHVTRAVTAPEVMGLAIAMGCSAQDLMPTAAAPAGDGPVHLHFYCVSAEDIAAAIAAADPRRTQ